MLFCPLCSVQSHLIDRSLQSETLIINLLRYVEGKDQLIVLLYVCRVQKTPSQSLPLFTP